jgi:hypothetical protein
MANIMIMCPILNKEVATGVTSKMVILETLPFEVSTRCPACDKTHKWSRKEAWIESEDVKSGEPPVS